MALVSLGEALHLHLRALLKVRQQRLGHSDPRLTLNVYTQVASEDDERVAAQLGELVTRNLQKEWVARIEQPFVN